MLKFFLNREESPSALEQRHHPSRKGKEMLSILSDAMMTATRMPHKSGPQDFPPRRQTPQQQSHRNEKRRRAWYALGGMRF
jgi:hypothetical protein